MSRLESIKKRIDEAYYEGYELVDDISFLLQLVARYETALKTITETKTHMQALYFANEALKE
jgi:hypothetical protein